MIMEEGRLCLLVDQLLVPLLANQKNCLGVSFVMKTPLSGKVVSIQNLKGQTLKAYLNVGWLIISDYPGALDAVETFTVQPAIKSSISVKIQMNTGWKNSRDDIKRPIF